MKTKTIKLYSFEELDEEVQERLIEKKQTNPDYLPYGWWDYTLEEFKREADELGFDTSEWDNQITNEITFDLTGRESHFAVYNKVVYFKPDVIDGYYITAEQERGAKKFGYYFNGFPQRGWFTSEPRAFIDEAVKNETDELITEDEEEEFMKLEEELNDRLAGLAELCKKYFKKLLKEYESYFEEDYIREELESWGEVWDKDGNYQG